MEAPSWVLVVGIGASEDELNAGLAYQEAENHLHVAVSVKQLWCRKMSIHLIGIGPQADKKKVKRNTSSQMLVNSKNEMIWIVLLRSSFCMILLLY